MLSILKLSPIVLNVIMQGFLYLSFMLSVITQIAVMQSVGWLNDLLKNVEPLLLSGRVWDNKQEKHKDPWFTSQTG